MPRRPRLHVPGGLYHVTLRGNDRQDIFFDVDDRQRWELLIQQGIARYGHRIHAYCWMTNHVHMAIQAHNEPLGGFVRDVASQYARSTNKKLQRTGHLFERRHYPVLVQTGAYMKELVRYIHLNPVRAGLAETASDYPWCSHTAYLNGHRPGWLTTDWALSAFGNSHTQARRAYARFLDAEVPESILQKFRIGSDNDQRILGDDDFIASLDRESRGTASVGTLAELAQEIADIHSVSIAELQSSSRCRRYARIRAEIGLAAVDSGVASNAAVARYFKRTQSALSRAINRLRARRK